MSVNMSFEGMSLADLSFFATTTTGSKLLQPLCDNIGLPIDKVNFLFAHMVFILLAIIYRLYLTKSYIPITLRHLYLLVPGLTLGFFCFGYQVLNLVFLTFIIYFFIRFCPVNVVQRFIFTASVVYLSALHLVRQIYDNGSYTLDITGIAMIAIQKITLLGFSLHDGMGREYSSLLDTEKRVAIKRKPTFIEYFSFVLTFQTFLLGLRTATRSLLWKGQLSKPISRLPSYSTAADDGTSLDYSNLKPVDLSYIKFDGSPAKSPVLILHGLFDNKNNWRSLGRMISERSERDTYVLDVRNHGESPHSDQFTYPIIATDVMHFMKQHSIERGVMVGHSLGGRAFSKLSFMQSDLVEKLVLVDVHPTHQIPANEYLSLKFCNILRQATEELKNSPTKLTLSAARKAMDETLKQQIPDTFLRQFFLASLCERDGQVDWKFNLLGDSSTATRSNESK